MLIHKPTVIRASVRMGVVHVMWGKHCAGVPYNWSKALEGSEVAVIGEIFRGSSPVVVALSVEVRGARERWPLLDRSTLEPRLIRT